MQAVATKVRQFLTSEDGATAVEYAVMLALIIVVCIAVITTLGSDVNATFSNGRQHAGLVIDSPPGPRPDRDETPSAGSP